MKQKLFIPILAIALASLFFFSCSHSKADNANINVTVKINYGKGKPTREINVSGKSGLTALSALQYTAKVETCPVGKYVFVTSIDNIKGEIGKMAWYYKINAINAKVLSIDNCLNDGDIITWYYTQDTDSYKVDNGKKNS